MSKEKKYPLFSALFILCFFILILIFIKYIQSSSANLLSQKQDIKMMVDESKNVLVPEASGRALLNYNIIRIFWIMDFIWGLAIPVLFIISGFSSTLNRWCEKRTNKLFIKIAVYFGVFYTVSFLLSLPLYFFGGFFRTHLLGLSNQAFLPWIITKLKAYSVDMAFIIALGWIPWGIVTKFTKKWWLITGIALIPFIVFSTLLTPLYIDPIYNKFYPMKDKALEEKILSLAKRSGIENCQVYVVDKSKETNTMNAYMTGLFNTKRIVIWDTSLKGLNENELLTVVGHEIGHYVMGHIPKSIAIGSAGALVILFLVNITSLKIIKRFGGSFGIRSIRDMTAIPVIMIVLSFYTFLSSPIENAYSRKLETDADKYAIELTHDNYSAATSEVKFLKTNLENPKPDFLFWLWNYTHPTVEERIRMSNEYKPWEKGDKTKFEKYIK